MVELFIQDQKAVLSEDIAADITYSLADIRTPEKRQVNFSKTIQLPGAAKNNYIFGNAYDLAVENISEGGGLPGIGVNFNPKKLLKAQIFYDGIQVFDGTLRLWRITFSGGVATYETSLLGMLFDIFATMADYKLTDLDFSEFNHAMTWENIQNTWADSYAGAFRYPYIDYGVNALNNGVPDTLKLGSLSACFYYKVFIDKIFSSIGASYYLGFSDRSVYDKMLVTPPRGQVLGSPKFIKAARNVLNKEYPCVISSAEGTTFTGVSVIDTEVVNTGATVFELSGTDKTNLKFISPVSTSVQIYLNVSYAPTAPGVLFAITSQVITTVDLIAGADGSITNLYTHGYTLGFTGADDPQRIEIPKRDFLVNDKIVVSFKVPFLAKVVLKPGSLIEAISPNDISDYPLVEGSVYDMQRSVPDEIKQVDFIKDFIKLFNLFVTTNPDNPKQYIFTPQVDFYKKDLSQAKDWTRKLDHAADMIFTPISQLTAKQYILTWKQDSDYWNALYYTNNKEIYGQVTYIADTDVIANTETVQMLFSPAVMTRYKYSQIICPAIYKVESNNGVPVRKSDKFNSRLLLWGGMKPAGHGISLLSSTGAVVTSILNYPYAGHLDDPITPKYDLNFGNTNTDLPTASVNTFSKYWGKCLRDAADKDGKLISCSMLLTPLDIQSLDFSALYKVGAPYFRLNKIEGFNPFAYDACKVELIKVVNL